MAKPMRETQRRSLINQAKSKAQAEAKIKIAALLRARYNALKRELRRANLKKRLNKALWGTNNTYRRIPALNIGDTDNVVKVRAAIRTALFKDDLTNDWDEWVTDFSDGLRQALHPVAYGVFSAESRYWETRNARPDEIDPDDIIDAYGDRIGHQIADIGEDTRDSVLDAIAEWYNTDAGLPELIDDLSVYFDEARAELIARTEASYIASEVSSNLYRQFNVEYFNVDVARGNAPWPCEICQEQADNNPHALDDEKPPYHPGCECGTVPATADGGEFIYG